MRVLCVGDIHGRHEFVTRAFDTFFKGKYDKIIFHGDYANGDRSNEDIIRCFNVLFSVKKIYPEKVILLVGENDEQYFHLDLDKVRCKEFRSDLHAHLLPLLTDNKSMFRYAYGIKNYLFTHAGVNKGWFVKHYNTLNRWAERLHLDIADIESWWQLFDAVALSRDKPIIYEKSPDLGGSKENFGSFLWSAKEEILSVGPIVGWHQVVGHTPQHFIRRVSHFEGKKKPSPNTSVTFIDVLSTRQQFLTLDIE